MVLGNTCKAILFSASAAIFSLSSTFTFAQEIVQEQEVIGPVPIPGDTIAELLVDHQVKEDSIFNYPEELIIDQLACLQNEIPLKYNKTVKGLINYLTVRKRSYTRTMLERKHIFFPIFEEELKKQGMPLELKYLPVVESGLNPRAVSVARAVGLWQFISSAGREYGLYQDAFIDERMDPYEATRAGVRYLKVLHEMFGDWELAMAAYNCGPGNVRRAIRRSGNKTGFWEIYNHLPRETRSYVPMFVAITYVMSYSNEYNIRPRELARTIPHDTIQVNQYLDLNAMAKQLNVPMDDLKWLNPHLKRNVVPPHMKDFVLRIPKETMPVFAMNRQAILDSASRQDVNAAAAFLLAANEESSAVIKSGGESNGKKRVYYTVRRGDALSEIADKYNVSLTNLRKWNHLRSNKIRAGQRLSVWVRSGRSHSQVAVKPAPVQKSPAVEKNQKESTAVASVAKPAPKEASSKTTESSPKTVVYKVQRGDTLWSISQIHGGIPIEQIKKRNKLKSNELKPGQKLIIG